MANDIAWARMSTNPALSGGMLPSGRVAEPRSASDGRAFAALMGEADSAAPSGLDDPERTESHGDDGPDAANARERTKESESDEDLPPSDPEAALWATGEPVRNPEKASEDLSIGQADDEGAVSAGSSPGEGPPCEVGAESGTWPWLGPTDHEGWWTSGEEGLPAGDKVALVMGGSAGSVQSFGGTPRPSLSTAMEPAAGPVAPDGEQPLLGMAELRDERARTLGQAGADGAPAPGSTVSGDLLGPEGLAIAAGGGRAKREPRGLDEAGPRNEARAWAVKASLLSEGDNNLGAGKGQQGGAGADAGSNPQPSPRSGLAVDPGLGDTGARADLPRRPALTMGSTSWHAGTAGFSAAFRKEDAEKVLGSRDPEGAATPFASTAASRLAAQTTADVPPDVQRIARQVATHPVLQTGGRAEMILAPEELGHLRLTVEGSDSALRVVIEAARPETADLMRRHVDALRQELRQEGLGSVSVSIGGGEGRRGGESGQERGPGAGWPVPSGWAAGPEPAPAVPAQSRMPGGTGHVDLRF